MKSLAARFLWCVLATFVAPAPLSAETAPKIDVIRTPYGGIQPLAQMDREGILHLIYFKGDPAKGDLFYTRREGVGAGEASSFSKPVRINQIDGAAIAIGTIRGAQFALGSQGILHVAWMGSQNTLKPLQAKETPILYTRSIDGGRTFAPERNLIVDAYGLDGGGTLAADQAGNVLVVWHGRGEREGEAGRRIWARHSHNDGVSFAPEKAIDEGTQGVCGCCGIVAHADLLGPTFYVLYRSAAEDGQRDMYLLASKGGKSFTSRRLDSWKLDACPMSSGAFASKGDQIHAAWETERNVVHATLNWGHVFRDSSLALHRLPLAKEGQPQGDRPKRRHPSLASGQNAQQLLCWTEGTGWNRGGSVHWQLFDGDSKPLGGAQGRASGLQAWNKPASVGLPSGDFLIVY